MIQHGLRLLAILLRQIGRFQHVGYGDEFLDLVVPIGQDRGQLLFTLVSTNAEKMPVRFTAARVLSNI